MHAASFLPTYPPHNFDPLTLTSRDFVPPNHSAHHYMHTAQPASTYFGGYSMGGRFATSNSMSYQSAQSSSLGLQAPASSSSYRYTVSPMQHSPPQHHLHQPQPQQSLQHSMAPQGWPMRSSPSLMPQHSPPLPSSPSIQVTSAASARLMPPAPSRRDTRRSPKGEAERAPQAAILYEQSRLSTSGRGGLGGAYGTRLPPILQVEKQQVTTSATQAASASRRRNEANFHCPVPGCGSTFTRRFNLRGHLRSHTEERPFVCEWPGCGKGFARQHDCKRHQALHIARSQTSNTCQGCGKTFSRLDALNRHRECGVECKQTAEAVEVAARLTPSSEDWEDQSNSSDRKPSP